jgi:hypothetical protein
MLACDKLPDRFNAAEWFIGRHVSSGHGDRIAITTDDGDTTFGELDRLVRGFAAALERQGLHRGDRVAIVLPDGPLFSISFWGTIAAGAVAVPLNTMLKPEKLKSILSDCDPRLLVFDPGVVDGPAIAGASCAAWESGDAGRRAAENPLPRLRQTHRDGFAFFYSSGTTGEPRRGPPPARPLDLLPHLRRAGPAHAPDDRKFRSRSSSPRLATLTLSLRRAPAQPLAHQRRPTCSRSSRRTVRRCSFR